MKVDRSFESYFMGRLRQVFLYITDRCTARCDYCLYKTTLADREMDLNVTLQMLRLFRDYGAKKLTLIGGEPTLYGANDNNRKLFEVVDTACALGYEYLRLDTNGQFDQRLLHNGSFKKIDNLAFSLDSHSSEINDKYRGNGAFEQCIDSIRAAARLGYRIAITCCVYRENLYYLDELIDFAASLGVRECNLHPLFKMGVPRDDYTGNGHIMPSEWIRVYRTIGKKIDKGRYKTSVRIPQRYIETPSYKARPDMYSYCPVRMGERVLIHPNGLIRICALTIGTRYHFAAYNQNGIRLAASFSEIGPSRLKRKPCMAQTKDYDNLVPLCISYKPFQSEYVWSSARFDDRFLLRSS